MISVGVLLALKRASIRFLVYSLYMFESYLTTNACFQMLIQVMVTKVTNLNQSRSRILGQEWELNEQNKIMTPVCSLSVFFRHTTQI